MGGYGSHPLGLVRGCSTLRMRTDELFCCKNKCITFLDTHSFLTLPSYNNYCTYSLHILFFFSFLGRVGLKQSIFKFKKNISRTMYFFLNKIFLKNISKCKVQKKAHIFKSIKIELFINCATLNYITLCLCVVGFNPSRPQAL